MTTGLSTFFKFNLWANRRLLAACSQLTDAQLDATSDGVYGSGRETIVHLCTSEEGYSGHSHFTGAVLTPMLREYTTFPGFDELRRHAERSGKELCEVAERADLDEILHLDGGT